MGRADRPGNIGPVARQGGSNKAEEEKEEEEEEEEVDAIIFSKHLMVCSVIFLCIMVGRENFSQVSILILI